MTNTETDDDFKAIVESGEPRKEPPYLNKLAKFISEALEKAAKHRDETGISDLLIECGQRRMGKYSKEQLEEFDGVQAKRNVTSLLCRTGSANLKAAFFNSSDKPWTIEPTPIPELPPHIQDRLDKDIEAEAQRYAISGQPLPIDLNDKMRESAQLKAMEEAQKACTLMSQRIEDQMLQGGWREASYDVIDSLTVYPIGVVKASIQPKRQPEWVNGEIEVKEVPTIVVENIDPNNIYFSPEAINHQRGAYLIERIEMSRASVSACLGMPSFSKTALHKVLDSYDDGELIDAIEGFSRDEDNRDNEAKTTTEDSLKGITVYEFWGRVSGKEFIDWLAKERNQDILGEKSEKAVIVNTIFGEIDRYKDYEINAWLIGKHVVRALVNPDPFMVRPYFIASYTGGPGSIYKEGIPQIVWEEQDDIDSAARALRQNMGYASGPIPIIDADGVPPGEEIEIKPWQEIILKSGTLTGGKSSPIQFITTPSIIGDLQRVMAEAWEKAHTISGIPPSAYGSNEGAADTLGAFSLQFRQSGKMMQSVITNIDRGIIEPLVTWLYNFNMLYADDPAIKCDAKVKTRGAEGLIKREMRAARPQRIIEQLGPLLQQIAPNALLPLIVEELKEYGYDPSQLGLSGSVFEKEVQAAQNQSSAGQMTPPEVPIDGRSAPAQMPEIGIPANQTIGM